MVDRLIADFGRQHGVCEQALAEHVSGFLHKRLYGGDGFDLYHTTDDGGSEDNEDGEDESDDDNEEDDSSDGDGMTVEEASVDDE